MSSIHKVFTFLTLIHVTCKNGNENVSKELTHYY